MEAQSIISHLSLGTNDFERALEFYDAVLSTLGCSRLMTIDGAAAYGKSFPEFWIQVPYDREASAVGNGSHVAFSASSKAEVDAFFKAAIAAGATGDGDPGPRPEYTDAFYGCYVRDLDGHKIEATYWDAALAGDHP